jgi:hypothetical protein
MRSHQNAIVKGIYSTKNNFYSQTPLLFAQADSKEIFKTGQNFIKDYTSNGQWGAMG